MKEGAASSSIISKHQLLDMGLMLVLAIGDWGNWQLVSPVAGSLLVVGVEPGLWNLESNGPESK